MVSEASILIVEDEPLSRDLLVRTLGARGYCVETAHDGPACLSRLDGDLPDLILLDVAMPDMSGLEVLGWIRRRASPDQLPVILVSAKVDSEDVVAGLEAGANDYVSKPVNIPVLLARIRMCLHMKRSIERLIEAERLRVTLTSLKETCDHLSGPLGVITQELEAVIERTPSAQTGMRASLSEALDWSHRVGELIEKFKRVANCRSMPYTEGLGGFVAASLEAAVRNAHGDGSDLDGPNDDVVIAKRSGRS